MIIRDSHGIIVQHAEKGTYDPTYMDEGDSASRTGIMALCGSESDASLLPLFFTPNPVRHPYAEKYNKPELMSRDQLICLFAGKSFPASFIPMHLWYIQHKSWFLNSDILLPQHWFHIYCCTHADRNADIRTILFRFISAAFLFFDVLWNCYLKPWDEQNQIQCILIVRGKKWLRFYCEHHPDWKKAIHLYWRDSFRDQKEIGEALINKIERTLTCNN